MRCPFCGHEDTSVKDSRAIEENTAIRRRRHCLECSARFSTVEHVQLIPLRVIKRHGEGEPFLRKKLLKSFEIALHKRPVSAEKIDRIVNSIIRQLETLGETDIASTHIGELVMEALSDLDMVAYIRYASVYLNFHAPEDFQEFVTTLQKLTKTEG